MDEIVSRILLLMKNNGLDQKTFAQQLGVRPQTITEWKQGVTQSYSKRLHQIANLLGTTVEYLLTGQQERLAPDASYSPEAQRFAAAFDAASEKDKAIIRAVLGI